MLFLYLPILIALFKISISVPQQDPDLSSLQSNYEIVESFNENFESWDNNNNDVIVFETVAEEDLNKLCKNSNAVIYIKQEDLVFDCKLLNVDQNQEEKHEIVKRSVNEEEEGSGNGDGVIIDESGTNQTNPPPVEAENIADKAPAETEDSVANTEIGDNVPKAESTEKLINDVTDEPTTTENTLDRSETLKISEDTPNISLDEVDTINVEKENAPESEIVGNTQTLTTDKISSELEALEKEVENIPLVHSDKTNTSTNDETVWEKKTNENKTGSGRTLINNTNKENTNDDRVIESKEPQKAASKDTTILVVLFAAVVVVGAAAFAYNFFKKRRQHNADAERLERAPNGKRNTNNINDEPEQKPLMPEKKEVEMVDLTKNVSESHNDGTVKT